MDGHENLIPLDKRTKAEQRSIARQGGIASGKTRREQKTIREVLRKILSEEQNDGATKLEVMCAKCLKGAYDRGDIKDLKTLAELLGELKTNISVEVPTISVMSKEELKILQGIANEAD